MYRRALRVLIRIALSNGCAGVLILSLGCAKSGRFQNCRGSRQSEAQTQRNIWYVEASPNDRKQAVETLAQIAFAFLPPHDAYAGQFARAEGWLKLPCSAAPCGEFRVNISDLDMGDPDLTRNVAASVEMLHGEKFPQAVFTVREISPQDRLTKFLAGERLPKGRASHTPPAAGDGHSFVDLTLSGDFLLKGVTVPLSAPVRLTAADGSEGGLPLTLSLAAAFTIDDLASRYKLAVPESGDPACDRVSVQVRLELSRK